MNCKSLPLTQDEITSFAVPIENPIEEAKLQMITLNTRKPRTRKPKDKKNSVEILKGNVNNFIHLFPNYSYLLTQPFGSALETHLFQAIIEILRPLYLINGVLILDSYTVSRLFAYNSKNDYVQLKDELASTIGTSDQKITQVTAMVYSTSDLANDNSLVMSYHRLKKDGTVDHIMGHFVFYSIDLETLDCYIIDTLNSDPINSNYFTLDQFKKLSTCLLKATNSQHRRVKSIQYKKTHYTQKHHECGLLALLNLVLSFENSIDYLLKYTLKNYNSDLANFRSILAEILLTNQLPLEKIKIS